MLSSPTQGATTSQPTAMISPGTACGTRALRARKPLARDRVRVVSVPITRPSRPHSTPAPSESSTEQMTPVPVEGADIAWRTPSRVRFSQASGTPGARSSACWARASSGSTVTAATAVQASTATTGRARPRRSGSGCPPAGSMLSGPAPSTRDTATAATASTSSTIPTAETTCSGSSTVPDWMNR